MMSSMGRYSRLGWVVAAFWMVPLAGQDTPFIPRKQVAPPGPPLVAEEAIKKMVVPEGFRVELVASEPDLQNPVAMAFDDRGRIFVTESFEYPRHEPGPGRDRIKILEDSNGDGKVDRVKIFAEGLNIPSGIAVGHGGVWVANAPDILFLEDVDGDDRADRTSVIATGFGRDDTHELPNALTWGPDGWLYGLNGVFNPCRVEQGGKTIEFTCAMFRIDPRTKKFELFCEGTSNPWGIAFDHEGSAFISACVIDHLWHLSETGYYHRQGGPYPPHTWKAESIVDYTHQMAAYCGIEYFESDAYPESFRNALYMGNIHGGCINVDRVQRSGSTYRGVRGEDFLTANDVWFMPVAQKVGPDGCLYILDWYDRYHCYQDASADPVGVDRGHGRLYRVVYQHRPPIEVEDFQKSRPSELIECLKSNNAFVRQRAQLEIAERQDANLVEPLTAMTLDRKLDMRTRLQSLWALSGVGQISEATLLLLVNDPDPALQAWAVRLAGQQAEVSRSLVQAMENLIQGSEERVQLQLAVAATKLKGVDSVDWLLRLLARKGNDELLPRIYWKNLLPEMLTSADRIEAAIVGDQSENSYLATISQRLVERWLSEVAAADGKNHPDPWLARSIRLADRLAATRPELSTAIWQSIIDKTVSGTWSLSSMSEVFERASQSGWLGISKTGNVSIVRRQLQVLMADPEECRRAREQIFDSSIDVSNRLRVLRCLLLSQPQSMNSILVQALEDLKTKSPPPRELIDFLLTQVVRQSEPEQVEQILDRIDRLPVDLQASLIDRLCQKDASAQQVLRRVAAQSLKKDLIGPNQIRRLAQSRSADTMALVREVFGEVRTENADDRQRVVREKSEFLHSLARGDIDRGWLVYDRVCGQCHQLFGRGQEVGPNITRNGRGSFEQLVSSVFDPSLVVGEAYRGTILVTDDDRVIQGILTEKNDKQVVLKIQGGKLEVIPTSEIVAIKTSPKSLMPEGVELQLSNQDIADLFALLSMDVPPEGGDAIRIPGTPGRLHEAAGK